MSLTKPGPPGRWTDFLTPEPNRQKWTVQPLGDRRTTPSAGKRKQRTSRMQCSSSHAPSPSPFPQRFLGAGGSKLQRTDQSLATSRENGVIFFFLCIIQNYLSRINLNCIEILEKISLILNRVSILILFLQGIWIYYYIYPNREAEGVDSKAIPQ